MAYFRLSVPDAIADDEQDDLVDLPDLETARQMAIRGVREILAHQLMCDGVVDLRGHLDISDGGGMLIASIRFEDCVAVKGGGR